MFSDEFKENYCRGCPYYGYYKHPCYKYPCLGVSDGLLSSS